MKSNCSFIFPGWCKHDSGWDCHNPCQWSERNYFIAPVSSSKCYRRLITWNQLATSHRSPFIHFSMKIIVLITFHLLLENTRRIIIVLIKTQTIHCSTFAFIFPEWRRENKNSLISYTQNAWHWIQEHVLRIELDNESYQVRSIGSDLRRIRSQWNNWFPRLFRLVSALNNRLGKNCIGYCQALCNVAIDSVNDFVEFFTSANACTQINWCCRRANVAGCVELRIVFYCRQVAMVSHWHWYS